MDKKQDQAGGCGDIIAHRFLECMDDRGKKIDVNVYIWRPIADPDGVNWTCPFEIAGLPGKRPRGAHGVDAIQALELALKMVGAILYTSKAWQAGRLTWLGHRNLGFPVTDNIRDLIPD